jgi:hypothetical protein
MVTKYVKQDVCKYVHTIMEQLPRNHICSLKSHKPHVSRHGSLLQIQASEYAAHYDTFNTKLPLTGDEQIQ